VEHLACHQERFADTDRSTGNPSGTRLVVTGLVHARIPQLIQE
jgi:hypothetical protein